MTAPVRHEGTTAELLRIVERAAADPERAPVLHPATPDELLRIAATWDERAVAA